MRLIDVNGLPHELTEHQVRMMITIGWLTFLAAWVMNICFYKTHPSSVDFSFSPKRFRDKMFIYIFGRKYSLICSDCCRGEREKTHSNYNFFFSFLDDQGDSNYDQRKESGFELKEKEEAADNDFQQQEN